MIKRHVEKAIKGAVQLARQYVNSLEEEVNGQRDHSRDDFAYPWLNTLFRSILKDGYAVKKPSYAWGVLHAAHLARALSTDRISVIEFGVAGGNGLRALENVADKVEELFELGIDAYGFDTGKGLPKPRDYRDLPNLYRPAAFPMDVERLKKQLKRAELRLGLVEDAVDEFIRERPSPIAFISVDLDYYSSTMAALKVLAADQELLLPRVHCYFDDIMGFTQSEYNGERLAIAEFNAAHGKRKISPIYGLKYFVPARFAHAEWVEEMYLAHIFDHRLYCEYDGLVRRPFGGSTDLREAEKKGRD